ncbi:DEAD/DEAH box helicase family protein [Wenyingzhuangia sp. IMCC45533]
MPEIDISQLSVFENCPIEFKEVNSNDFQDPFTTEGKIIIEPNEQGYINDALQSNILLNEKDTTVINAAVGQGKSYGIIQTVKRYYDKMQNGEDKYLIFVASPFVSLVKQYVDDIQKDANIPKEDVFNYGELGRNPEAEYVDKPIQVVTANTLLGNHGVDSFKSSKAKMDYINNLIKYSEDNDLKVVFIFDEIHDAYHNFENKFIFNLWKWKHLLLKNYVISATFNEASKIVIEFLAELTDFKIRILESKRTRFPEKQSKLHLHYSNSYYFKENTPEIVKLIKSLVTRNKNIDILCHSKTLANSIKDKKSEIGKLLHQKYGDIKLCVSENVSNNRMGNEEPKNQFSNYMDKDDISKGYQCNIGTNFKTGVSIKKENHAFVIIFPPRSTRLPFKNLYGIFSKGMNDIIQSLARQRVQGEIHIVMPTPNQFNYSSLEYSSMSTIQKELFAKFYDEVKIKNPKEDEEEVRFYPIKSQYKLLSNFYNEELYPNVKDQVEEVGKSTRNGLVAINYPTLKEFIFSDGEKFLANQYLLFGADLSAYVTYSAITNQFINCRLVELNAADVLFFEPENIRQKLAEYYKSIHGIDYFNTSEYDSFGRFLDKTRRFLFDNYTIKIKHVNSSSVVSWKTINEWKNRNFEKQILGFCIEVFYGLEHLENNTNQIFQDADISRQFYLSNGLKDGALNEFTDAKIVRFFEILKVLINKIEDSVLHYETSQTSYAYLFSKPPRDFFSGEDVVLIDELIALIEYNEYLKNNIFHLKARLNTNSLTKKKEAIYKFITEDFFEFEPDRLPTGNPRPRIKKNIRKIDLSNSNKVISYSMDNGVVIDTTDGKFEIQSNFTLEI